MDEQQYIDNIEEMTNKLIEYVYACQSSPEDRQQDFSAIACKFVIASLGSCNDVNDMQIKVTPDQLFVQLVKLIDMIASGANHE